MRPRTNVLHMDYDGIARRSRCCHFRIRHPRSKRCLLVNHCGYCWYCYPVRLPFWLRRLTWARASQNALKYHKPAIKPLSFAARVSGLAFDLARAVRPAGSAEVSGAQGWVPKIVSAKAVRNDLRVPLTLEGPARTMRGVPARDCDIFTTIGAPGATLTAWSWYWRARQRDTAGTAGGQSPGCRARQPPRRRACVRRTRRSCRPRDGETRVNLSRLRRATLAAFTLDCSRRFLAVHGQGRQARRAGGAPLKVVSRGSCHNSGSATRARNLRARSARLLMIAPAPASLRRSRLPGLLA